MKKFTFTLQAVYDIALDTERQRKLEMQRIEARLQAIVKELIETKAALHNTKRECQQKLTCGIDAPKLIQYDQYCDSLHATISILQQNKTKVEREKEKCLQAQIENRREIKTLEKLRDKQYEEYLLELRREEEKEIGDLVAYRTTISEGQHG